MKMNSGIAGKISSFIVPQICRYARLKVCSHPSPTPPKMRARKSSVKEIGKAMKMTATMPTSMMSPRVSAKLMDSDLDLLVPGQGRAGSPSPDALHELRDTLQEEHEGGQRNDAAQRPQDRHPGTGARALVDRERVQEIIDRDEEQHDHRRQEQQQKRQAVDHALRSIRECLPQYVGSDVSALQERQC